MTRIVLDTNVVVSALIQPFGNEAQVIHAVLAGTVTPCFSNEMLEEYAGVLARPKFGFPPPTIAGLLEMLQSRGSLVAPAPLPRLSPDPKDDPFIACVVSARAVFLVTGNRRHFPAKAYGCAKVVSARELLVALDAASSSAF